MKRTFALLICLLALQGCVSYPSVAGSMDDCPIVIYRDGSYSLWDEPIMLDKLAKIVSRSDTPTDSQIYVRVKGKRSDPEIAYAMSNLISKLYEYEVEGVVFLSDRVASSKSYTPEEYALEKAKRIQLYKSQPPKMRNQSRW